MDDALKHKLENLPSEPGVYLMKDRAGKTFYVGKAVNLHARVRSYFTRTGDDRAFVPLLDRLLCDLEVVVVHSEKEALLLENELIKRYKPRFNVLLRDDKDFICLRLDERAAWPRLEVVRAGRIAKDGARYFGPYSSASSIRQTLRLINKHFQLRTCTDRMLETCRKRGRACMLYQIGRCPGPCIGEISEDEYARNVRDAALFLEGKEATAAGHIRARMQEAAARMDFEAAARLRDQLRAVERSLESQKAVSAEEVDRDVFGVYREADRLVIYLLVVRSGRVSGGRAFAFAGQEFPTAELLGSFTDLYYGGENIIPDEVLLPLEVEGLAAKEAWLSERKGRRVVVKSPRRGAKAELVEMAGRNAELAFREKGRSQAELEAMLKRLEQALSLSRLPRRIECFDISLFQGSAAVGSQVAFQDGEPDRAGYRRYRIKTVEGTDDFAMIYEVLARRARRAKAEGSLPDLLLIDGGKGQLGSAAAALRDEGVTCDLASLAKSRVLSGSSAEDVERSPERVFVRGRKDPIVLRQDSPELFLLARVRDEAHRFAITYHRSLRKRSTLRSALEDVPGVGDARRRALLRRFGSLRRLREATEAEIAAVDRIGHGLAAQIHRALRDAKAAAEKVAKPESLEASAGQKRPPK